MSVKGEIREAFSGRTIDVPPVTHDYTREIIEASRRKYCTPRVEVEQMLAAWDEAASVPLSKEELVAAGAEEFEEPLI
jgi:predicted nucleic acid-binding protein